MFQIPVTPTERHVGAEVHRHELRIEYVIPTAMAPPAGRVLATVVVVWVSTAD